MAHLIDKAALVAEIKRILSAFENSDAPVDRLRASTLMTLLSFIDTLEVKEVDLNEHQIADIIQNLFPTDQFIESETLLLSRDEAILFAKHFFALGLKAKQC